MTRTIATLIAAILGIDASALDLALTWATTPEGVTRHNAHMMRRRVFANLAVLISEDVPMGRAVWNVAAHIALHDRPRNVRAARQTAEKAIRTVKAIAEMEGITVAQLNARAALAHHEAITSRAASTVAQAKTVRAELEAALAEA